MPIIERTQKQVLFEEAARQGITQSRILSASEIYDQLVGLTDVGQRRYGHPMAPIYTARDGELIDVSKMSAYFKGVARDLRVLDLSLEDVENRLNDLGSEMWARMQLVKSRATLISKAARTERARATLGALWAATEGFGSTAMLDMQRTTAWVDASEGVAFLPNASLETSVPPADLKVVQSVAPEKSDPIGSKPEMAFDGLESTSWRTLFLVDDGVRASATVEPPSPKDVSAISIDPIGAGIDVVVETDDGTGFKEMVRALVYAKRTFPVEMDSVLRIRVSYRPAPGTLPKVVGLREITVYTTQTTRTASIYSLGYRPDVPFTDVRIETKGQRPAGSDVRLYAGLASGGPWTEVQDGVWKAITPAATSRQFVNIGAAVESPVFRGLFGAGLSGGPSASATEGTLEVGVGQVEVTCFERDWADQGEIPHILTPGDFDLPATRKTWTPVKRANVGQGSRVAQGYGTTSLAALQLTRGREVLFDRDPELSDTPDKEMVFVPLGGSLGDNMLQLSNNYRFRFWVHCEREFFFGSVQDSGTQTIAKYWFLQGYRKLGSRAYKEVGKSWGSFSLYVNDELVTGDSSPFTIYDVANPTEANGGLEAGSEVGRPFSFRMKEGWNKVEVLISLVDPSSDRQTFQDDPLDEGDPYLQLSITPDLFDPEFQARNGITQVLGSGQRAPSSEFDLLWNLPRDAGFWAWSEDRTSVLFNQNTPKQIDGFFRGTLPTCFLNYRSSTSDLSDLFVRIDSSRDPLTRSGPTLDEYKVMVK